MNEQSPAARGLVKISELAKATGVSVSTLKFYVKEGLIVPACKTGKNMAWYDPAYADTVRTIRKLQKERYYPLSVIKSLLESPGHAGKELRLLDAIHKVDYGADHTMTGMGETARKTRLTTAQITRLTDAGLITPEGEGGHLRFSAADISIMQLIRRRMDAGIPFEQSVQSFGIYDRALREAARADVSAFISGAVLSSGFSDEAGARMIRISDETLDNFVAIRREEYNRLYGSGSLEDLYRFRRALDRSLRLICCALEEAGLPREAFLCAGVSSGRESGGVCMDEAARQYRSSIYGTEGDIAGSTVAYAAGREYFTALKPESAGADALPVWCLKLCWLCLAPEILVCVQAGEEARSAFDLFLHTTYPAQAASLTARLTQILNETRESYEYL